MQCHTKKDKALDALEQIREKLETLSKKENLSWENELFVILDELDGFVRANFKDGENKAES